MSASRRQPPTRVPPKGRRATILRATLAQPQPLSRIVDRVRLSAARTGDPSIDRLKTREAVRDLRADGFVDRTRDGWLATPAGVALLRASEGHHG